MKNPLQRLPIICFGIMAFLFSNSLFADEHQNIAAAHAACYSALAGNKNHSLIIVPLPSYFADLDEVCHSVIDGAWHAGGVAKPRHFAQNCGSGTLSDKAYGGWYTSYVTEATFEAKRSNYSECKSSNAFVCCSTDFPN